MQRVLAWITHAFPLWVALGGALALVRPAWFTWFSGPWIVWGLAVIMLGMGLTLTVDDLRGLLRLPRAAAVGLAAQYTVMPALGWLVGRVFGLPTPFAVGLILVSCCPGGTASNVVTYLARAHVALSVLMTLLSTLAAVLLTPWLTGRLAGTLVAVDGWGLFRSTVQVVLAPVVAGIAINRLAGRAVSRVLPVLPLVSVVAIVLICSSIIGGSAGAIRDAGFRLLGAVFAVHAAGFALGYAAGRVMGFDAAVRRTIAIEVGMQNSGLGVVLARRHFADPLTAVPAAISSVFHSVIGSALAGWWRWRSAREATTRPAGPDGER